MNEIKKIHLGRQPFTISIEAHRALRAYLDAIEHQVGKKGEDVLKEIELRMAELLTERGISADKVVLEEDVDFLKEQLGAPGDFKDEGETKGEAAWGEHVGARDDDDQPKRLYRDPQNAMVAGVAAGLAAYFRIDPLIVRLIFVVLTITGGAGILMYILLWILVPEAKSPSERLQMRGKAVTVDNIKDLVDRADVPAAANRVGKGIGRFFERIFQVFLAIIGVFFAAMGAVALLSMFVTAVYMLFHSGQIGNGSGFFFPIGAREGWAAVASLVTIGTIGLFLMMVGVAMIRRKWSVPSWATASVVGLFFVGATTGAVLGTDIYPGVRQRFRDTHQTQVRSLQAFKNISLNGEDARFIFKPNDTYSVHISYMGKVTDENVTTKVEGDTLTIDSNKFTNTPLCTGVCFYSDHDLVITVQAPSVDRVTLRGADASFNSYDALRQDNLIVDSAANSRVYLTHMYPEEVRFSMQRHGSAPRLLELYDLRSDQAGSQDLIRVDEENATISRVDRLKVDAHGTCDDTDPVVRTKSAPQELRINSTDTIKSVGDLRKLQTNENSNDYNCVDVRS